VGCRDGWGVLRGECVGYHKPWRLRVEEDLGEEILGLD